jgi:predicted NAD/FAD-binding protein
MKNKSKEFINQKIAVIGAGASGLLSAATSKTLLLICALVSIP